MESVKNQSLFNNQHPSLLTVIPTKTDAGVGGLTRMFWHTAALKVTAAWVYC
jgi:hypothetical protein